MASLLRVWCCFLSQDPLVQPARWQKQTASLAECFCPLPQVRPQTTLSVCLSFHPMQVPLDNFIPERAGPGSWVPTEPKELEENEVIPKRISSFEGDEDVSNKVSMSSTAQGSSIFERTEVLAGKLLTRDLGGGEDSEGDSSADTDASGPRVPWRLKDYTSLGGGSEWVSGLVETRKNCVSKASKEQPESPSLALSPSVLF